MAWVNGVNDGARTHDHQSHNLVLCQLSYVHHKKQDRLYMGMRTCARHSLKAPASKQTLVLF